MPAVPVLRDYGFFDIKTYVLVGFSDIKTDVLVGFSDIRTDIRKKRGGTGDRAQGTESDHLNASSAAFSCRGNRPDTWT